MTLEKHIMNKTAEISSGMEASPGLGYMEKLSLGLRTTDGLQYTLFTSADLDNQFVGCTRLV